MIKLVEKVINNNLFEPTINNIEQKKCGEKQNTSENTITK